MKTLVIVEHFFRDEMGNIHSREAIMDLSDDGKKKTVVPKGHSRIIYADNGEKATVPAQELSLLRIRRESTFYVAHITTKDGKSTMREATIAGRGSDETIAKIQYTDDKSIAEVPARELIFLGEEGGE